MNHPASKTVQEVWDKAIRRSKARVALMTEEEKRELTARNSQQMLTLRGWDKKPRIEPPLEY